MWSGMIEGRFVSACFNQPILCLFQSFGFVLCERHRPSVRPEGSQRTSERRYDCWGSGISLSCGLVSGCHIEPGGGRASRANSGTASSPKYCAVARSLPKKLKQAGDAAWFDQAAMNAKQCRAACAPAPLALPCRRRRLRDRWSHCSRPLRLSTAAAKPSAAPPSSLPPDPLPAASVPPEQCGGFGLAASQPSLLWWDGASRQLMRGATLAVVADAALRAAANAAAGPSLQASGAWVVRSECHIVPAVSSAQHTRVAAQPVFLALLAHPHHTLPSVLAFAGSHTHSLPTSLTCSSCLHCFHAATGQQLCIIPRAVLHICRR